MWRLLSRCRVEWVKQFSLGRACPVLNLFMIMIGMTILRLLKCSSVWGLDKRMEALKMQAWCLGWVAWC